MPPVRFRTYDYNLSPYINMKQTVLATRMAQNRWGSKFRKYWKRHATPNTDHPEAMGTYDFTEGMRVAVASVEEQHEELQRAENFRDALKEKCKVKDDDGVYRLDKALKHSFFVALIEKSTGATPTLIALRFALALENDGDERHTAWWHESGTDDDTASVLHPIEAGDSHGLYLHDADGHAWGHYDGGLKPGTTQSNALETYTVEDRGDSHFHPDQETFMADLWPDMQYYAPRIAREESSETVGERTSVVFGLNQLLQYMNTKIDKLTEGIADSESNEGRAKEDLELMDHVGATERIAAQVDDVDDVESIWFRWQRTISPPTDEHGNVDTSYAWWEEEQFNKKWVTDDDGKGGWLYRIHDYWKDFKDMCVVDWDARVVRVKAEAIDLPGWKIYLLVQAFLDTDFEESWWAWLKKAISFAIGVMLALLSDNPVFIKAVLIAYSAASALGIVTPEMSLIFGIAMLGYGISSANWSAMSGLEQFGFAIRNVEQVARLVQLAQTIGMKEQAQKEAKHKADIAALHQQQGESTEYIYTRAYSQYDMMYNALYRYDLPSLS